MMGIGQAGGWRQPPLELWLGEQCLRGVAQVVTPESPGVERLGSESPGSRPLALGVASRCGHDPSS